jgi:BirA family biotin operon repressor/biotin-[acetyl-CoA-carboxylase] ligase
MTTLGTPRIHRRSTGSTSLDARALALAGAPHGTLVTALEQHDGRGRQGRRWHAPPGEALLCSLVLRDPPALLAIVAGVAVAELVGPEAMLKWPNDVLAGDRKLAGILAEQTPDGSAVVIGTGLNVAAAPGDLPVSAAGLAATSLRAEGATVSREDLLLGMLIELERWYVAFRADPDPERSGLRDAYRSLSGTLGRTVRVELPAGRVVTGVARDIDAEGRLLVADGSGDSVTAVSAGDVVHVRAAGDR